MGLILSPGLRLAYGLLAICVCAAAIQGAPAPAKPYPLYPELYDKARAVLDSGADPKDAVALIDEQLKTVILAITADGSAKAATHPVAAATDHPRRLGQLFCLRGALKEFAGVKNRDMAVYLLDHPAILGRFLHAMWGENKCDEALGVLKKIKEADAKAIESFPEFCIAFAVVWRDYHPYIWVEKKNGPVKPEQMMDIYKHFATNRAKLAVDVFSLPYELAEYVVAIPVSTAERDWVMKNYAGKLDANVIYRSVPWSQKLSPAHGFGDNFDYTLMNIRNLGGVCMEQAYFTEQVFRIRGVPASYMEGMGAAKIGGHAWFGEFRLGAHPAWDFTVGRYRENHYYQGEAFSPVNSRKLVGEATIMMTAAAFSNTAGCIERIEKSNYYLDAAMWVINSMPMDKAAPAPAPAAVAAAPRHVEGSGDAADQPATAPAVDKARIDLTLKMLKMSLSPDANPANSFGWTMLAIMSQKHLLDNDQAIAWGKNLIDMTLGSFPEYSVRGVGDILECVKDDATKVSVYSRMFNLLTKRPDLACEVKVAEGDVWAAKGDFKTAIQCYVYPMVNFSKDVGVLDKAKDSLEKLDDGDDDKKVEAACLDNLKILYSNAKRTPEQIEAGDIILKKLVTIYNKRKDDANADKYRKMISK